MLFIGGGFLGVCAVYLIIAYFIGIWWKMIDKAGEKGWKILIPFYGIYLMIKLFYKRVFLFSFLFTALIVLVYYAVRGTIELELIGGCAFVLSPFWNISLARRFGHSWVYGIGLCGTYPISAAILAWGSAQYVPWEQ